VIPRAVVLARGRGQRMRMPGDTIPLSDRQQAAAQAGWKALMPIAGRPFLDFVLSAFADAGGAAAALVIGPEQHAAFAEYVTSRATARLRLSLIEQTEPRGTADAVRAAADWLGDAPFLVLNGDNLYPIDALRALNVCEGPALAAFDEAALIASSNISAGRIAEFATVEVDADGYLTSIVEKPARSAPANPPRHKAGAEEDPTPQLPGHRLVSMNAWRLDRRAIDACRDVAPSARGEYELPDAVSLAMSRGVRFAAIRTDGGVLDLSRQADIVEVERRLRGVTPRP
jgi:glucose-1-phosphate thymidylyltransferase